MLAYKECNSDMRDDEIKQKIISDMVIMMFTGEHTFSASLSWTFILLAEHPHVAKNLHDEVNGVLKGADVSFNNIAKMPYLQAVIKEILRVKRQPLFSMDSQKKMTTWAGMQ